MLRRRAARACRVCRTRKRKCDGKIPSCTSCESIQAECRYEEPGQARISHTQRLEKIESLLQTHTDALATLFKDRDMVDIGSSPCTDFFRETGDPQPFAPDDNNPDTTPPAALSVHRPQEPLSTVDDEPPLPVFMIPLGHQTSTSSLLITPQVRALAGTFPHDSFFRLEARRSVPDDISFSTLPSSNGLPSLDRRITDKLVEQFFTLVYTWHPIFDREAFTEQYARLLDRGLEQDEESAVCLVALALGAIASEPTSRSGRFGDEIPGSLYFKPAFHILVTAWVNSFGDNIILSQGLVLSALYCLYLLRPLQAWRAIHMASTAIQQTLNRLKQFSKSQQQIIARVCWSCFLLECDTLAEFDHPRSGIEPLIDKMPFPKCGNPPMLDMQLYLTELSVRCLLNRIHHALHFTGNTSDSTGHPPTESGDSVSPPQLPSGSLIRICTELERQLKDWYDALPDGIRPDLSQSREMIGDPHRCLLRLRYWSARLIIYRPFVIYTTSNLANGELAPVVLDNCEACVSSCRSFLYAAGDILSTSSPYTYGVIQSCLACILILSLAGLCPALQHLVPDIDSLQELTIDLLKLWKSSESSLGLAYEIAVSIRTKQRLST